MAPKSSKKGALSSDISDELNKLAAEAATGRGAGRKAPRDGPAKSGVDTAHDNTPAAQSTDVFVAGLHKDASVADLEEAFGDAGPVKLAKILKGGRGMLSFVLAADASRCVAEMQGTPVRGAAVSISLGAPSGEGGGSAADSERRGEPRGNAADESDAAGTAAAAAKPVKPGVKLNTRLFRIIVRNLPFGVKEAAVRGAFARFGELEEVHLPTKPGRNGQPEGRGFAFLQFATKKEAAECVETGNGMEMLGRPVAVDWAVAKEVYAEVAKPTKKQEREAREKERKEKLEAQRAEEAEQRKKRKADEEVNGAKGKKSKGDKDQGAEEVGIGGDINTTVFVRNIPLESSEQELAGVMRPFGKIIFCRMVMDKTTGKHRGSAFVKYAERSAARAAVDAGAAFTGSEDWEQIQRKQDRKKSSSAFLRGTIQDEFQSTLQMHGRHLFVAFAVDRQTSEKLVAQEKEKIDRRNLHLAKEGLILADTPAAKGATPKDLAKRLRDWQEKKEKLSNTNFSVNRTRLAVRNISKGMSEASLRTLFHNAAQKQVDKKVANGSNGAAGAKVKVTSARLVLDKERIDPVSGRGFSKGYGFVEFAEHEHALLALRKLNNCAETAAKHNDNQRLMVDFSLDDARILRTRRIKQARLERGKQQRAESKKEEEEMHGKPMGRGAKQRAAKRSRPAEVSAADFERREERAPAGPAHPAPRRRDRAGGIIAAGESRRPKEAVGDRLRQPGDAKGKGMGKGKGKSGEQRGAARGDDEIARVLEHEDAGDARGGKRARGGKAGEDEGGAAGTSGKGKGKGKGKGGGGDAEGTDGLDKLVASYSKKLFAGGGGGRWFD